MKKNKALLHEIKHHLPFTIIATALGILAVLLIQYLFKITVSEHGFEILHPLHVIASGAVSAGVFFRYKQNFFKATIVGIISAITIGTLSDILFPYTGAFLLKLHPHLHLPIVEEPLIILGAALIGSLIGIFTKRTKMPHAIHVGLSVFASLFYLMAFTEALNLIHLIISIFIISIAVIIPCYISDVFMPFLFLKEKARCHHCKK